MSKMKEFIVDFVVLIDGEVESHTIGARARNEHEALTQARRSLVNRLYRTIVEEKYCRAKCEGGMALLKAEVIRCGDT